MPFGIDLGVLGSSVVLITLISFIFLMFLVSRYRKFKTNEFVIYLRNGRVRRAGAGGRAFLMPLIDEVIIIPTTIQQTSLEAREKVVSREYQNVSVTGFVFWQVTNPSEAFSHVSWNRQSPDYVETVIRNAAESIIRTTCANMPIEEIIRERRQIIEAVITELHELMATWGVTVHSVEIRDVEVLDPDLKENMEAVKKAAEEEKAKLRRAQMIEVTRTRDLEVMETTGKQEQMVQFEIQKKAKEREIMVQDLERNRIEIEADADRRRVEIAAQAKKAQLVAQAEGEAAQIRQALLAEAEGEAQKIMQQADALKQTDARFLQLQLLQGLPEIYRQMPIEKMYVLGDGQSAFGSIAGTLIPFVQVIQDLLKKQDEVIKEIKDFGDGETQAKQTIPKSTETKDQQ
ncbi:MAG: SPFH domain-containing protein [Candidatus Hodarchaeota archaeon]